jgi:hypothetical protein
MPLFIHVTPVSNLLGSRAQKCQGTPKTAPKTTPKTPDATSDTPEAAPEAPVNTVDTPVEAPSTTRKLRRTFVTHARNPLERRAHRTPTSGPSAPPAPSCPVNGQATKKIVLRPQVLVKKPTGTFKVAQLDSLHARATPTTQKPIPRPSVSRIRPELNERELRVPFVCRPVPVVRPARRPR